MLRQAQHDRTFALGLSKPRRGGMPPAMRSLCVENTTGEPYLPKVAFSIFAQVSRRVAVRLKTRRSGVESRSTQK